MEFIPGFDHGGWFDAGDFDIETKSHCSALLSLTNVWEAFKPMRDETYINQDKHLVVMHRPDGTPDMLQQIEHGVLPVLNMVEKIGHSCRASIRGTSINTTGWAMSALSQTTSR